MNLELQLICAAAVILVPFCVDLWKALDVGGKVVVTLGKIEVKWGK